VYDGLAPFISYSELNVNEIDIFDDAWGFAQEFPDIMNLLGLIEPSPPVSLVAGLLERIEGFTGEA
jgi:hypothetical protein